MPTERTGQSLSTLLNAAKATKARENQTDHDIRLEQQSRKRDADLAAKNYKEASPLEKAQMELAAARDVHQTNKNEAISKNTDPIAFEQWQKKVETSRKKVKILTQKVNELSSLQKTNITLPDPKKQEEINKFSANIAGAKIEVSKLRDDLRNINETYAKAAGVQNNLTNKVKAVDTELAKNTTELEKLKNQRPIKQFPLFKLFVNKQKEHDKKIVNLEQQNKTLGKEKNNLTAQLNELTPKIAKLENQRENLSKDIKARDNWIHDAQHKLRELATQLRASPEKKNDNQER